MSISIPGADYTPQLTGYTGQGAFRFWCQKVLPIVYDDSLSYYELLNKVVNYLNNVIADVASVEENVGALNDSYGLLQAYVNEHMQEIVDVVNEYTEFTTNYFNNLDVQEEINTKLDVMASDGSLSRLIGPIVVATAPDVITQWLNEHITPTTPIVDNTLTVSGAAADAKTTGDTISELRSDFENFNAYNIINDSLYTETQTMAGLTFNYNRSKNELSITGNKISGNVAYITLFMDQHSLPKGMKAGETYYMSYDGVNSILIVYNYSSTSTIPEIKRIIQGKNVPFTIPEDCTGMLIRAWISRDVSGVLNEVTHPIITDSLSNQEITDLIYSDGKTLPLNYIKMYGPEDADEFTNRGYTFVSYQANSPSNWTNLPISAAGWLINLGSNDGYDFYAQIFIPYEGSISNPNSFPCAIYCRRKTREGWEPWTGGANTRNLFVPPTYINNDANNLSGKLTFASQVAGQIDITNVPYEHAQFLLDLGMNTSSNIRVQFSFPYLTNEKIYYRIRNVQGNWSSWIMLDTGGTTTTITQEVSRDTYNNTYNITTSPQITTDANGWLRAIDTNTSDESNKTDMTGPIMSMLTSTGYCHLGPGIFYVSGNIDMPAGSMIEGCGDQTIIRLLQTTTSGYIVRMHTKSAIKNVRFSGGYNAGAISNGNISGRRGINYVGNRDGQTPEITPSTCTLCMITGCWFENLDSGIYGYNAGGSIQQGLEVSNCYFTRCKAGINLDYWVEYSKFTNCVTYQCYYACINNGGNNVFTACTFHGVIGFLIDNSADNKPNAAHGSCVGCTFNHIDSMNNPSALGKGIAIKVLNTTAGFLFANCQLWYGRIHIETSKGVQITGCEIGGLGGSEYPVLETSGDYMVFVDNCLFQTTPTKATASPTKFTNCWTYDGVAVT